MGLFGKTKTSAPAKGGQGTAFIGAGLTIKGKVSGSGNLIMMGRLEGEFDLDGELVISPPAEVKGEVKAVTLSVSGAVQGTLSARERIHLEKSARVQGTLAAPRLAVEDGAFFNGESRMPPGPQSAASAKRAEPKKAAAGKDEP
ncbi:MAG: polymer-forming cytoskeletal protein [Desulfobacterales bacterium]|jgi:cytoskeletal protein CcmA (bactofilin family)|nr:polymer-forming cytoskeletal protein [Desulfobacterales bacterium]